MEREAQIGAFRAGILAIDDRGRKVIIENQFGPTDHMHFGQIVLYGLETSAPASPTRWLRLCQTLGCASCAQRIQATRSVITRTAMAQNGPATIGNQPSVPMSKTRTAHISPKKAWA